jgi:HNH endonuclease
MMQVIINSRDIHLRASRLMIDQLQPRSLGGSDTEENLALACNRCNQNRYNFVVGRDLETSTISPLFNPRNQLWQEHFIWSLDATKVIETTAIGRATCDRLDMNDDKYKGERLPPVGYANDL